MARKTIEADSRTWPFIVNGFGTEASPLVSSPAGVSCAADASASGLSGISMGGAWADAENLLAGKLAVFARCGGGSSTEAAGLALGSEGNARNSGSTNVGGARWALLTGTCSVGVGSAQGGCRFESQPMSQSRASVRPNIQSMTLVCLAF